MDRLICGDVGYGKTEVAIRAAFKAVQDGKTGSLSGTDYHPGAAALQHLCSADERFSGKSGFCFAVSAVQQNRKRRIEDLKKGMVDIVIGTHRVLSKDVQFKDLGLLIIDEEQRFGVTHKEKIKQMKEDVDVLTLTATPIPQNLAYEPYRHP